MTETALSTAEILPHKGRGVDTIAAIVAAAIAVLVATATVRFVASAGLAVLLSAAILALALVYAVIILRWRWGVYALIAFIPFAGLPTIALYPGSYSAPATQLKDVVFVLPAYVGFAWWYARRGGQVRLLFRGFPVLTLAAFVAILIIHALNPANDNLLVKLVGLKVWLFYVPLMVLGYHLVQTRQQLLRLGNVVLIVGIIPVLIGLAEAVLIYSGNASAVYDRYGAAAAAVTQNFGGVGGTGGDYSYFRIPSTFTFVLPYFLFLLVMLSVVYALWSSHRGVQRMLYLVVLAIILAAALTSGARAGFALIPGFFLVALAIAHGPRHRFRQALVLICGLFAGFLALVTLLGSTPEGLLGFMFGAIYEYVIGGSLYQEFPRAFDATWWGLGVGMSTGPARVAFAGGDEITTLVLESYYAKAIVEIGVPGMLILITLLVSLLVAGFRAYRRLCDPVLRAWGTSLFALLTVTAVYLVKGAVIDYDPLNAYFWLLAGLLMKLPRLEASSGLTRGT